MRFELEETAVPEARVYKSTSSVGRAAEEAARRTTLLLLLLLLPLLLLLLEEHATDVLLLLLRERWFSKPRGLLLKPVAIVAVPLR